MTEQSDAAAVRDYWFGPPDEPETKRRRRWFGGQAATDRDIHERFGALVEQALSGGLQDWESDLRDALSLVLVLDQFPRNCFRGSARAFAGDERARRVVGRWLEERGERDLTPVERSFFYLPLEHSERLADHERAVALFSELLEAASPEEESLLQSSLDYALAHRDIIRRFGRYPHRNKVLGRVSTPAEAAYLAEGAPRYGQ